MSAAPEPRLARSRVEQQSAAIMTADLLKAILDGSPALILVLNSERQIVYCSRALLEFLQMGDPSQVLGKRPGEAMGCANSGCKSGCGTAEACSYCGALMAILDGLAGRDAARECRINRVVEGHNEALEFAVQARPLAVSGENLVILSLLDISHEKRRRALERIFFHDVLNTANCVQGLADVVAELGAGGTLRRSTEVLRAASRQLVREITNQRALAAAENAELQLETGPVSSRALLANEVEHYQGFPVGRERRIEIDPESADVAMLTDRTLLGRVIGNMLSNALEATRRGGIVRAGCREIGSEIEFWVHNAEAMRREVQLQVFQRSFSTKGSGRGLGTYSMRLLTEAYLGGQISFTTSAEEGTVFRARYPRVLSR